MFCYQRSFGLPTEVITIEQFRALIRAPRTLKLVKEAREALARGDKSAYDNKKKGLPFVIFIATYDESDKKFENKQTGEKTTKRGCWRNQKFCRLNGLCVIDFDHVDEGVQTTPTPPNLGGERLREIWAEAYDKLSDEDKARVLFVFITPSGHGLKVVFMADVNVGNLIDNQKDFSAKLGLNPDEACKDASRGAFLTTSDDVIFIDEEKLFTYEDKSFGEKYNDEYRSGHSQPTVRPVGSAVADSHSGQGSHDTGGEDSEAGAVMTYDGVPYVKIIEAWLDGVNLDKNRHNTLTELASHLRYLIGRNPKKITEVVMSLPWVKDLAAEGEDVAGTVSSVMGWRYNERMPDRLREALGKVGALDSPPKLGGVTRERVCR